MQRNHIARVLLGALLLAGVTAGASAQSVIKIAVGAPLTGPLAKQGQEVADAVRLAVEEWNARGGVLGKKIEVMAADDQGNPQVAVAAAEKVAADPAVIGTVWGITSVTCIPVSEILQKANLVLISPICAIPGHRSGPQQHQSRLRAATRRGRPARFSRSRTSRPRRSPCSTTAPPGRRRGRRIEKRAKALGATVLRYRVRAGDRTSAPFWALCRRTSARSTQPVGAKR